MANTTTRFNLNSSIIPSEPTETTTLRRTKIVCSVGPNCKNKETLEKLLRAGVNVFRLNFSFGDHDDMRKYLALIKEASESTGMPYSILGDLQGPKFRTGDFEEPGHIPLEVGKQYKLVYTKDFKGNKTTITCPNDRLLKALSVGDNILIADGAMKIKVIQRISETEVMTEAVIGGTLASRKGLNIPTATIEFDDILDKDKKDALFLLEIQADYIGQSFVQTAEDVKKLKQFLLKNAKEGQIPPGIIAKIEKPRALKEIDSILAEADGIMVARGDLGVELSLEMVPVAQKLLISKANKANKPVITATQMLQSMISESVPTRAEVSDVFNAIFDGTDTTMTSNETAMGQNPPLVIETMSKILTTAESYLPPNFETHALLKRDLNFEFSHAVAASALEAAERASAKAMIVFSAGGKMATLVSKGRPRCPIIVLTSNPSVARRLNFLYGIYPIVLDFGKYSDTTIAAAENEILSRGWIKKGDTVVLCSGTIQNLPSLTNLIKLYHFGSYLQNLVKPFKKS